MTLKSNFFVRILVNSLNSTRLKWSSWKFNLDSLIEGSLLAKRGIRRRHELQSFEPLETRCLLASIVVTPVADFFTTEAGDSTQFSVVLDAVPMRGRKTATVMIPIQSSNSQEGIVGVRQLTFTSSNWNIPQSVTVTGVDDAIVDGDREFSIVLGKVKTKAKGYKKQNPPDLKLSNRDNDGIRGPVSISTDAESPILEGSSRTVTASLSVQPTADVTLVLTINQGATEAQLSVAQLTFTPDNWSTPQSVQILAKANDKFNLPATFTFSLRTTSVDPRYSTGPVITVTTTIVDSAPSYIGIEGDFIGTFSGVSAYSPGIIVDEPLSLSIYTTATEFGRPDNRIVGTVNELREFRASNGRGFNFVGNVVENPDGSATVSGTWETPHYKGGQFNVASGTWTATRPAPVKNELVVFNGAEDSSFNPVLDVSEGIESMIYFHLMQRPTSDVVFTFAVSTGVGELSLLTNQLTFTPDNWALPQALILRGISDDELDGDQSYQLTMQATSEDSTYHGVSLPTISGSVFNTDVARLNINPQPLFVWKGEPGELQFSLNTQPSGNVTVSLQMSPVPNIATLSTATLEFTPENWNLPQVVTVTAIPEAGPRTTPYVTVTADLTSNDSNYQMNQQFKLWVQDPEIAGPIPAGEYEFTLTGTETESGGGTGGGSTVRPYNRTKRILIVGDVAQWIDDDLVSLGKVENGRFSLNAVDGRSWYEQFSNVRFTTLADGSITGHGSWTGTSGGRTSAVGTWTARRISP